MPSRAAPSSSADFAPPWSACSLHKVACNHAIQERASSMQNEGSCLARRCTENGGEWHTEDGVFSLSVTSGHRRKARWSQAMSVSSEQSNVRKNHARSPTSMQQTRPLDASYLHRQSFPCQNLVFLGQEEYLTSAHLLGSCCL